MSLRLTIIIDPDKGGEELVGLLAKGFSRGELGIAELRIEQAPLPSRPEKPRAEPPRAAASAPEPKQYGRRGGVDQSQGAAKVLLDLITQAGRPVAWHELRDELPRHDYKATSNSSLLNRLQRSGLIERLTEGSYVLAGAAPGERRPPQAGQRRRRALSKTIRLALRGLTEGMNEASALRALFTQNGFSPNSAGSVLSKLKDEGLVSQPAPGVWEMTSAGRAQAQEPPA